MRNRNRMISILLATVLVATSVQMPVFAAQMDEATNFEATNSSEIYVLEDDVAEEQLEEIETPTPFENCTMTAESEPVSALDGREYFGYVPDGHIPALVHDENEAENSIEEVLESSYGLDNLTGTPILGLRQQNPHGTCWAFASVAAMEASLVKQGYVSRGNIDLSELQTIYFSRHPINNDPLNGFAGDTITYGNLDYFANGSSESFALQTFAKGHGLTTESAIPYIGFNEYGTANYATITQKKQDILSNGLPASYSKMRSYMVADCPRVNFDEPDVVKSFVKKNGALTISYHAAVDDAEKAKYLSDDRTSYYDYEHSGVYGVNHAITLVGWDDNYSKYNFKKTPSGNGAWLVRNSWAYNTTRLDNYNYFWLSYYDTSIWSQGYAFRAIPAATYDNNYQYDGGYGSASLSARQFASIYTAKANSEGETLKAVAMDVASSNVNYKIEIYRNLTSSTDPTSGTIVSEATTEGSLTAEGYYTIPLRSGVSLPYGTKYSVVITLSQGSSSGAAMTMEYNYSGYDFSYTIAPKTGQSFYRTNTIYSWNDVVNQGYGDFRIKAFTKNGMSGIPADTPPETPDPYISINTPANGGDVYLGGGNSFTISASYPANVRQITYSSETPSVATVDASGNVKAISKGNAKINIAIQYPLPSGGSGSLQKSFTVHVVGTAAPTYRVDSDRNITLQWSKTTEASGVTGYIVYSSTGAQPGTMRACSGLITPSGNSFSFVDDDYYGTTDSATVSYIVVTTGKYNGVQYTLQSSIATVTLEDDAPDDPDTPAGSGVLPLVKTGKTTYKVTLVKGQKIPVPALKKQPTDGKAYEARTTNKNVAVIGTNGIITAKGPGTCQIIVSRNGMSYTCSVKVTDPGFAQKSYAINVRTNDGKPTVLPLNFTGTELKVDYSIPVKQQAIAQVDAHGNLTAVSAGKVKVTANVYGKKYTCNVRIYDPRIKTPKTNQIAVGKNMTLKVTGGVKTTTWSSKNSKIAIVNEKGKVVGIARGTTEIYAINNGVKLVQKITVY